MNQKLWLRVLGIVVVAGVAVEGVRRLRGMNEIGLLMLTLIAGLILGLVIVNWLLPRLGDMVATGLLGSGERVTPVEGNPATACLARGDYEGAILELKSVLEKQPEDTMAIAEIARIQAQWLHQPRQAVAYVEQQLASRAWKVNDEAFLRFRLVDLHAGPLNDAGEARHLCEQIITKFPGTPHAGQAQHRLHELSRDSEVGGH